MAWFGKKKDEEQITEEHIPSGMKEIAARMMAGEFNMNDMLAQLKQMKKMAGMSGLLKMIPGAKDAVAAMKEKIADGSIDRQIKIIESMTAEERAAPDKIFANAKQRIADASGATVREVEQLIKRYEEAQRQMKAMQAAGGMQAMMEKMKAGQPQ